MTRIDWTPLLPWSVLGLFAAVSVLILGFGLWRRAGGTVWRGFAVLFLLLALAGPSLVAESRAPQKDIAVIVVDESPSQRIADRMALTRNALATLQEKLARFRDLEVRVVRAGAPAAADRPTDRGTALFAALDRALADIPRQRLAGAVMITDGQVHDLPPPDRRDIGAPLHILLSGAPGEGDRRLTVKEAPRFGIVDKEARLTIRVDDLGTPGAGGDAAVALRQDGVPAGRIRVPIGQDFSLPVAIRHGGPNLLELDVEPGPRELTLDNNRAAVAINGVRDRLRVLLVTGEPHAGERSWRDLLKADPSVDLVHFTILRPPEKLDTTPVREMSLIAFPVRELFIEKLSEFDLVIFDRYRRKVLPEAYLENIAQYVREGGALLDVSAPVPGSQFDLYHTPLYSVLAAEPTGNAGEEGFKPRLSAVGQRHPVTAGLPGANSGDRDEPRWGRWFRQVEAVPHRGEVAITGGHGAPLLVLDRVGKGRVAQLLSDEIWLWTRGFESGGPQAELLRRLVYWLIREPDLEENDLRAAIAGNILTVRRQSLEQDERPVHVTFPDGTLHILALKEEGGGRSAGRLAIRESGLYRIADGEHTALAAAGPLNPVEMSDVRTTADILSPAVSVSGGGMFWLGAAPPPQPRRLPPGTAMTGRDWIGFRENGDYIVTGLDQIPLLAALPGVLLVLGTLGMAWRREGR